MGFLKSKGLRGLRANCEELFQSDQNTSANQIHRRPHNEIKRTLVFCLNLKSARHKVWGRPLLLQQDQFPACPRCILHGPFRPSRPARRPVVWCVSTAPRVPSPGRRGRSTQSSPSVPAAEPENSQAAEMRAIQKILMLAFVWLAVEP